MGEHTPGPWIPSVGFGGSAVYDGEGRPLIPTILTEADARLIAAAPDLLAALEMLAEAKEGDEMQIEGEWGLSTDPGYGEPSAELVAARAAIAKAKGEA